MSSSDRNLPSLRQLYAVDSLVQRQSDLHAELRAALHPDCRFPIQSHGADQQVATGVGGIVLWHAHEGGAVVGASDAALVMTAQTKTPSSGCATIAPSTGVEAHVGKALFAVLSFWLVCGAAGAFMQDDRGALTTIERVAAGPLAFADAVKD